jgi:hypothetical protein
MIKENFCSWLKSCENADFILLFILFVEEGGGCKMLTIN